MSDDEVSDSVIGQVDDGLSELPVSFGKQTPSNRKMNEELLKAINDMKQISRGVAVPAANAADSEEEAPPEALVDHRGGRVTADFRAGKRGAVVDDDSDDDDDSSSSSSGARGPRPGPKSPANASDSGSDSDFGPAPPSAGSSDDDEPPLPLPVSHEAVIPGHTRAVSAIKCDPSGARIVTGGLDENLRIRVRHVLSNNVAMYDFAGMTSALRAFRELQPQEGAYISDISWSITGDSYLCATSYSQPQLISRDGAPKLKFIKGDQYVMDLTHTKGHVAAVVSCRWHPTDRATCMTSSVDGSVRLWDIHTADKSQKTVIRPRCERGTKVSVSCATYLPNASIAAICHDGSLQLWGSNGPYHRPEAVVRLAHQPASTLVATSKTAGLKVPEAGTCVAASPDSNMLLTRGTDHTLKVWDVRRLGSAVATHENLHNHYSTGACMFSPDGSLYMTGTSIQREAGGDVAAEQSGLLMFYKTATLQQAHQIGFSTGSVVALDWSPKLNQLFVGTSTGKVHCLYDPIMSNKGIMLGLAKTPRKADPGDQFHYVDQRQPHGQTSKKRQAIKDRQGAATKRPMQPRQGPESTNSETFGTPMQYFLGKVSGEAWAKKDEHGHTIHDPRALDPREAIIAHAEAAKKNPFYTSAYAKTQPKPIYQKEEGEESK